MYKTVLLYILKDIFDFSIKRLYSFRCYNVNFSSSSFKINYFFDSDSFQTMPCIKGEMSAEMIRYHFRPA